MEAGPEWDGEDDQLAMGVSGCEKGLVDARERCVVTADCEVVASSAMSLEELPAPIPFTHPTHSVAAARKAAVCMIAPARLVSKVTDGAREGVPRISSKNQWKQGDKVLRTRGS